MFCKKVVIITGASAGVGAACARSFAQLGAKLVLVARGQAQLEAITNELQQHTEVLPLALDVASEYACETIVDKTMQHFGAIHYLINNAGLHHRGNFETRSAAEVAAMVDVNLRVPVQLTAAALPVMQQSGGGAIVMVGSLAGRAPLQGAATYSATKTGLRTFSYALADELRGSNIHVGVVSPGPIDTGFIMDHIDEVEDIVYSQPMSTAQQVADAVIAIAKGGQTEICLPWASGKLTTIGYLFPRFRRLTRGLFYKIGRRNKEKYRQH